MVAPARVSAGYRGAMVGLTIGTMLKPATGPGLFITGTDTEVGKTVIAAAVCDQFRRAGMRVAACKPVATGCEHRREGLVSPDAELLAHCGDVRFSLDTICPQRYAVPAAPLVSAEAERRPLDYQIIQRSLDEMQRQSDILVVEGIGGVMVPLDARHSVLDMILWLRLPVVLVASAKLGTINHTLLTLAALRTARAGVAGVVINRYPAEQPTRAEETAARIIERFSGVPVLCIVPERPMPAIGLPPEILAAVDAVDFAALAQSPRRLR